MAFAFVPASICATAGVKPQEAGLASAVANTSRLFGGALGLAILATIATVALEQPAASPDAGDQRNQALRAASSSRSGSPAASPRRHAGGAVRHAEHPAAQRATRRRRQPPGSRVVARDVAGLKCAAWRACFVTRELPGPALDRLNDAPRHDVWPERLPPPYDELREHARRGRRAADAAHRPDRRRADRRAARTCGRSPTTRSATTTSTSTPPPRAASRSATRPTR